jgi:Excreted virulence factor EspC, type VII ESX diderm
MRDGYEVDLDQLRAHARSMAAIRERFAAAKAASAHITLDGQAYGRLCGWIAVDLAARHDKHDELIAFVENNLDIAEDQLDFTADDYEDLDADASDLIREAGGVET